MSTPLQIVFAGSFLEYSAIILEKLLANTNLQVLGVLSTPPQPSGRSKALTPTPVHQLALDHHLPVFTPSTLDEASLDALTSVIGRPAYLVTAGYGKLVPASWLAFPTLAALNLHFSLLPKYRGANPAEWALVRGETTTGVTLIEMSPTFDTGQMIAQSSLDITSQDTRETLYQKLYQLGGEVLPEMLIAYDAFRTNSTLQAVESSQITYFLPPVAQGSSSTPYAQRLVRDDGFISWSALRDAQAGGTADSQDLSPKLAEMLQTTVFRADAVFIERVIRALAGFPGVWTMVETAKGLRRLKILTAHLENERLVLETVQLEGHPAANWNQIKSAIT